MKFLGLMYFSHIVCSFSFHPPITEVEQMGKNEKIASGNFYFASEIVLTFESLEGYTSLSHGRLSQMNSDTLVIAQGREGCSARAGGEDSVFPGVHDLFLPPSQQEQREEEDKAALETLEEQRSF